jgi:hypothetical protein
MRPGSDPGEYKHDGPLAAQLARAAFVDFIKEENRET